MGQLSKLLRKKDVRHIVDLIIPEYKRGVNWIVQGLPDSGVELVFSELVSALRADISDNSKIHLIELDFSSFWTKPLSSSIAFINGTITEELYREQEVDNITTDISTLLAGLSSMIEKYALKGHWFVFVFEHFDAISKFPEPDNVQYFLNVLQELCYNTKYHCSNIVQCYRDIDDICRTTNYSDYYKIFGSNHFRVTAIPEKKLHDSLLEEASDLGDSAIRRIVELSAGYPEHADVVLRFAREKEFSEVEQFCLDALDLSFKKWEDTLTPGERDVLRVIKDMQVLEPEHFSDKNKLRRKGIVQEKDNSFRIASPLFALYLSEQHGKTDDKQKVFLRRAGNLVNSAHIHLLEKLFNGRYYVEWKLLQRPLPGDATVYLITGEDQNGNSYRPCIVKIDSHEKIVSEVENMEKARDMLGPIVPEVLDRYNFKGQEAIIIEYATGANYDYSVKQFADFYREKSAAEVENLIFSVLRQAMFPFYKNQKLEQKAAKQFYYLPRLHQGEFEQIDAIAQRSKYFLDDELNISIIPKKLPVPGTYLRPNKEGLESNSPYGRLFVAKRSMGTCYVHGDLNPRNFLVDGIGNIHLIDFSEMKEGWARFLDFVRLEVEIKFKLTEFLPSSLDSMLAVETLLVNLVSPSESGLLKSLPLEPSTQKMICAVTALRKTAWSLCEKSENEATFNLEYKIGLLAQTLRISLFQDYLSEVQQEFAVLSSAMLIDHIEHSLDTL